MVMWMIPNEREQFSGPGQVPKSLTELKVSCKAIFFLPDTVTYGHYWVQPLQRYGAGLSCGTNTWPGFLVAATREGRQNWIRRPAGGQKTAQAVIWGARPKHTR
eukprot:544035-Amphidinium_carterae.1